MVDCATSSSIKRQLSGTAGKGRGPGSRGSHKHCMTYSTGTRRRSPCSRRQAWYVRCQQAWHLHTTGVQLAVSGASLQHIFLCSTGCTASHTCGLHLYSLIFGSPGCPNVRFNDDTFGGPCRNSMSVCCQGHSARASDAELAALQHSCLDSL